MYNLSKRLRLSAVLILISALIAFFVGITYETQHIIGDERDHIRKEVDMVYGVLVYYNDMVVKGQLSKEAAQKQASETIRTMSFGNGSYFWIHNYECVLVMHPVNPEYEGQYRCDFPDKNGKLYYRDFQEKVKSPSKSGYVEYEGPKPGSKDIRERADKVSYVRGFEPWGWVIGTGFYKDSIYAEVRDKSLFYGMLYGIFNIVASAILVFNISPFVRCFPEFTDAIRKLLRGSDDFELSHIERKDELGEMAREIERLRGKLRETNVLKSKAEFISKGYFTDL